MIIHMKKNLKFKDHLAKMVLAGEKTTTWRLFDDKDLSVGDSVDLINKDTGEVFARATLTVVYEKTLGTLEEKDFEGHERFGSMDLLYQTYKSYYPDRGIGPDTKLKIIHFIAL